MFADLYSDMFDAVSSFIEVRNEKKTFCSLVNIINFNNFILIYAKFWIGDVLSETQLQDYDNCSAD